MLRLLALGTCDLAEEAGPPSPAAIGLLAQTKPTAVLAFLALAAPRGFHQRDRLAGWLWPELDQAHARAALRKAIYLIRLALGEHAVLARGDEAIALAPDALGVDARDFEDAVTHGALARALELYRGDLLPGFSAGSECAEFGQWLDGERARLRALAARAGWHLADRAQSDAQGTHAGHWAGRAVQLGPDDERALLRALQLLAHVGDRAGALRVYDQFARRLRTEFAAEPSAETQGLLRALLGAGATR